METPDYRGGLFCIYLFLFQEAAYFRKKIKIKKKKEELENVDYSSCGVMSFNWTIKNASQGNSIIAW